MSIVCEQRSNSSCGLSSQQPLATGSTLESREISHRAAHRLAISKKPSTRLWCPISNDYYPLWLQSKSWWMNFVTLLSLGLVTNDDNVIIGWWIPFWENGNHGVLQVCEHAAMRTVSFLVGWSILYSLIWCRFDLDCEFKPLTLFDPPGCCWHHQFLFLLLGLSLWSAGRLTDEKPTTVKQVNHHLCCRMEVVVIAACLVRRRRRRIFSNIRLKVERSGDTVLFF